jgi:hypothetical protein
MSDLGTLGQPTIYSLAGEIEHSPLLWNFGASPNTAVAQSEIVSEELDGAPLEYWLELVGRNGRITKVVLTADDELFKGMRKFSCLFDAAAAANQIERSHQGVKPTTGAKP